MILLNVSMSVASRNIVVSDPNGPDLTLLSCLLQLSGRPGPWGLRLHITEPRVLQPALATLAGVYKMGHLLRPVWVSATISHGSFTVPHYVAGTQLLKAVADIFPAVTLAPSWPEEALEAGYQEQMVLDMLDLCKDLWQPVSFQLAAGPLSQSGAGVVAKLLAASPRATVTVGLGSERGDSTAVRAVLQAARNVDRTRVYFRLPPDLRQDMLEEAAGH